MAASAGTPSADDLCIGGPWFSIRRPTVLTFILQRHSLHAINSIAILAAAQIPVQMEFLVTTKEVSRHYTLLEDFYQNTFGNGSIHYPLWFPGTRDNRVGTDNSNRVMAQACQLRKEHTVLDAGCGLGSSAIWLAEHYHVRVLGISISESNIRLSRWVAAQRGVGQQVEFAVANFMNPPLRGETCDVVWNLESFNYASPKRSYVKRVIEILRPGGIWVCLDGFIDKTKIATWRNDRRLARINDGFANTSGEWEAVSAIVNYMKEAGFVAAHFDDLTRYVLTAPRHGFLRSLAQNAFQLKDLALRRELYRARIKLLAAVYNTWRLMEQNILSYGLLIGRKPA